MFKKLFSKKENKGYISIETIIIAGIMLSLLSFFIVRWAIKGQEVSDSTLSGMEESIGKIEDPTGNEGDSWFDDINDSDDLLGGNNTLITKSFELEKSITQDQETTITLDKLTKIKNITASNRGQVEIISIEGDTITFKVIGGEISESIVISGEYLPYDEKTITNYDTSTYDVDGYKGTLTQYVESGETPKSTTVTETKTFTSKSDVSDSIDYNLAGYKGTLAKTGTLEETLISGTAGGSKTVSGQNSATYSDSEGYKGTLTAYVISGSAPLSKTVTDSHTSQTNSFADTINYNSGGYSGSLNKYGSVTSTVIGGSAGDSKNVTAQTSPYYNDGTYSGTLTQYVYSGSYTPAEQKQVSLTKEYTKYVETLPSKYSGFYTDFTQMGGVGGTYYTWDGDRATYQEFSPVNSLSYNQSGFSGNLPLASANHSSSSWYNGIFYSTSNAQDYNRSGGTLLYLSNGPYKFTTGPGQTAYYNYYNIATYTGIVTKPAVDTRVYRYQGIVSKPDTRVYNYTQIYSGTAYTEDTRVYKYQGTVTKPDTRVYEYIQSYTGTVSTPDTRVYKYQGIVSRPESDTRVYEHYYQYDVDIEYYERKDK